jgi:peptidyl-tRNA hydrolase
MAVVGNRMDEAERAAARRQQNDPWVMYFVCPRRPERSSQQLLQDAAQAAVRCREMFRDHPDWTEPFRTWEQQSFRKVTLRARPAQIERVQALDHAQAGEIICLPPRRRSEASEELTKLQAHTGGALTATEMDADQLIRDSSMLFVVNADLEMTLGKALAQVGHAALMALDLFADHGPERDAVSRWRQAGAPAAVMAADTETFCRIQKELLAVVVRDAGLTQVAAGSETVLAVAPGARPGWLMSTLRVPA